MEPWQQERAIGVLQQAIAIEKEGKTFYQGLANKAENPQVKSMFNFLVTDEQSHVDKPRDRKSFFDRAKDQILPRMKADFTQLDVLKVALDMENKGYAFYEKAAADSADPMLKGMFQYLMGQEKEHRELLTNTLVYLEAPLDWFGKEERHMFDGG
jgi:rubrerythrin